MEGRLILFLKFLAISFLILLGSNTPLYANTDLGPTKELFRVDKIEVQGTRKVEVEAIIEKLSAQEGMIIDNYTLRRDLKKIYSLKYFEFVEAHHEKRGKSNVLIFKVKEKPIITTITFAGNDEIDDDDLKAQIKTKEFTILDVNTINIDVGALQKQYEEKGFYLAAVSYELKKISDENVELVFNIKEFDKVKVKKVSFLGNSAFTDAQLKGIMETQEEGLFSFMSNSGNFKEFNFQTDIERIKYFYKTKGYLLVNVGTPEVTVSEDKRWVFITLKINEGPEFSINDIYFQGEVLFSDEKLFEAIQLKSGEIYSEESLRKDVQKLTEMYQDEGYAFANVLRTVNIVPGENKVNVEFSFEKGRIASFGKITVKGNTKTRDKVIRRELKIKEGAKFSGSALRISKENVNRLGFFEPGSVIFNTVTPEGKNDVLDVEITVKERNTGQISLGAGFSTANGFFMNASVAQNNFRGLGQNLSLNVTLSGTQKVYSLGFTEPYFMDSKWTLGGDIFNQFNEGSRGFSYKRNGFNVRLGYPIFDYTRLFTTYKYEDTTTKNSTDPTIDENIENGVASSIGGKVVRDKRNNTFEPSSGYYTSFGIEYAGLGGHKKWFKTELDGRYYHTIVGDLVFRSRFYGAKLEVVDDRPIPRAEKFALGGPRNMRGYDIEGIGPKTVQDVNGVPIEFNTRGLFATFATLELEHPLAREAGLKWVVFFDAGNVFDQYIGEDGNYTLRADYGFGFRWFSPIGVLRFEFGYPIGKKADEESSQFFFDIGQLF